jgi:hypothetical protein
MFTPNAGVAQAIAGGLNFQSGSGEFKRLTVTTGKHCQCQALVLRYALLRQCLLSDLERQLEPQSADSCR